MATLNDCPVCGEELGESRHRVLCPRCHAPIPKLRSEYAQAEAPAVVVCGVQGCGQVNPAGADRCVYCNEALQGAIANATLSFPWGDVEVGMAEPVEVGRSSSRLGAELSEYRNVSRRHARLEIVDGELVVVDLGSTNGTFVNGEALSPDVRRRVAPGDEIRFGADLIAGVRSCAL